jgi:hypothetical protein
MNCINFLVFDQKDTTNQILKISPYFSCNKLGAINLRTSNFDAIHNILVKQETQSKSWIEINNYFFRQNYIKMKHKNNFVYNKSTISIHQVFRKRI